MTNPKIEKIKADIAKTKAKLAEYQAKLREQEKALKQAEDEAILAMFKDETISDEQLKAVRRQGFGESGTKNEPAAITAVSKSENKKEETRYATETDI
jgi:hypothetical protein